MHGLLQELAWSSHVESHVAVARHAINLAIVERKAGIVGKEAHQLPVVKTQAAAVEPHQE